jgi:hypothetical protein
MKWPFIGCLAMALTAWGLTGCSTYGYKTPLGEKRYAPVDYRKVKLLFGAPREAYEVIGVVSVQGGVIATAGDMYQKLIKSAAELGADAVIVTGEGANTAVMPGSSQTRTDVTVSGNTAYANSTTNYSPAMIADMPTNKGLAIKFTR